MPWIAPHDRPIVILRKFFNSVSVGESCWQWTGDKYGGSHGGDKYGRLAVRWENRWIPAHRFSYEKFVGPIPGGLTIDHLCRNTLCVRPDHLEAVAGRTNTLRGNNPAAQNARKTSCRYGHPYSGSNLIIDKNASHRRCRTCRREEGRRRRGAA